MAGVMEETDWIDIFGSFFIISKSSRINSAPAKVGSYEAVYPLRFPWVPVLIWRDKSFAFAKNTIS